MKQRATVKRDSIVARFALNSLTTAAFRWLLPEAWDDANYQAFLAVRQTADLGIFRAPPAMGPTSLRRHAAPVAVGRWLLEFTGEKPVMAVEAHAFYRNFKVLQVIVAGPRRPLEKREEEAFSLMISGLFIMTKADLLNIIPSEPALGAAISALHFGESRQAWSPAGELIGLFDEAAPVGRKSTTVTIDPHQWWETERGARDRQTLAYLEKRVDLGEKIGAVRRRSRPNLMARLSRFMRWG